MPKATLDSRRAATLAATSIVAPQTDAAGLPFFLGQRAGPLHRFGVRDGHHFIATIERSMMSGMKPAPIPGILRRPAGRPLLADRGLPALVFLGYNLSVAVCVGLIALAGVDAETGMVMLLYLDVAYERHRREGRMEDLVDLNEAILEGAVQRVRPKMMTVKAILMGLLPIMWGSGTGSDVMKRIAAPMVGGVTTSFIMELLIYPAVYTIWKSWSARRGPVNV